MQNIELRTFQTEFPVFARREFTANGKTFRRGEDFDWKSMGIKPEKVEALYGTGHIRHRPRQEPVAEPKPVEQKKKRK